MPRGILLGTSRLTEEALRVPWHAIAGPPLTHHEVQMGVLPALRIARIVERPTVRIARKKGLPDIGRQLSPGVGRQFPWQGNLIGAGHRPWTLRPTPFILIGHLPKMTRIRRPGGQPTCSLRHEVFASTVEIQIAVTLRRLIGLLPRDILRKAGRAAAMRPLLNDGRMHMIQGQDVPLSWGASGTCLSGLGFAGTEVPSPAAG